MRTAFLNSQLRQFAEFLVHEAKRCSVAIKAFSKLLKAISCMKVKIDQVLVALQALEHLAEWNQLYNEIMFELSNVC